MVNVEESFAVRTFNEDGSVVVVLEGELDIATAPQLRAAIAGVVHQDVRTLTVDGGALRFADVCGQRALVDLAKATAAVGGRFVLRGLTETVRRAIGLVGFTDLERACSA